MRLHRALLALVPLALACAQDATAPRPRPKDITPIVPVIPLPVAFTGVAGLPSTVLLGQDFVLRADQPVHWETSDSSVAAIFTGSAALAATARVAARKEGAAWVIARLGETAIEIPFTVVSGAAESSAIEVESIEFTEVLSSRPTGAPSWYLSPRIRVTGAAGNARVVGAQFTIPGIGPSRLCVTDRVVGDRQSVDLFNEIDGSFELEWGPLTASQLSQVGSARLFVADAKGAVGHIDVAVPVVRGVRPLTWSYGAPENVWTC